MSQEPLLTEDGWFDFFQMGGVVTLSEAIQLCREDVDRAIVAREKHETLKALVYSLAHDAPDKLYSTIDGGEAARRGLVKSHHDALMKAWREKGRPVDWSEL